MDTENVKIMFACHKKTEDKSYLLSSSAEGCAKKGESLKFRYKGI